MINGQSFVATEFDMGSMVETGSKEDYTAQSKEGAVKHCLYTHSLVDGRAFVGATGLCVYSPSRNRCYTITSAR